MGTKIDDMAKFAKFCKDMGFIYQSSEIYGGINGFWDYGPLGVELKRNIKEAWWQDMVRNPPPGPDGQEIRMVGLDCAIIMNPKVWIASGHAGGFQDPMVACTAEGCKKLLRADKLSTITIYRRGTFSNMDEVKAKRDDPTLTANDPIATVVMEKEAGTPVFQASAAIKQFAQKNNHAALKKFVPHPSERDTTSSGRVWFFGCNEPNKGENFSSERYDYECIIEDFTNAKYATTGRPCPVCHTANSLTEPRAFNLMNETHTGPIKSDDNLAYLRPETAQGIFVNFKNVLDSSRLKLPFGIGQVGKAFRNEINPRNFTFRSREFEQMEIEFFCHPDESRKWYEYWRDLRRQWYICLGLKSDNLVPREQGKEELAHYSVGTTDIEYKFPFSDEPQELEGVAHRGDFDLRAHGAPVEKHGSGKDLGYFDEEGWNNLLQQRLTPFKDDKNRLPEEVKLREEQKKKLEQDEKPKFSYVPHVIEPSAGADRFTLAVLCEAYTEEEVPDAKGKMEKRLVMKFHPRLAPIKAAIFPLVNKDGMDDEAKALYRELKPYFNVVYDQSGAIGRRYRRQDEAGTPFCITIDGDTKKDGTVTIRDRDTLKQERIPKSEVRARIEKALRSAE